jgi:hypothetical protein
VVIKSTIFWDITPCSPLSVNRRGFLLNLFFNHEDGGDIFLRMVGWHAIDDTTLYPRRRYSSMNFQHKSKTLDPTITTSVMKDSMFWDITPCRPFKLIRSFGRICRLHFQGLRISQATNQRDLLATYFMLVSYLAYSSTVKAKATWFSETSVNFHWTT